ncbi:MAG: thiamine ABC transporter substrate-binding protein [Nocardioides sp.]|nr:thiamine ABC transporter substrate-binding protein [Nocardioides sp.]
MRCVRALTTLIALAVAASGCSLAGGGDDGAAAAAAEVVLVTHESFVLPDELQAAFEQQSGLDLVVRSAGDAGTLTNKLVLTTDDPTGDVAFGVDNTFASRAVDEGVFAPVEVERPAGTDRFALPADAGDDRLVPIDNGNVCVNVDTTWFAERGIPAPTGFDDLVQPAYRDLLVSPGATTSSPGLAFLLATVAQYGDGWPAYWAALMDNGARLTEGWADAYQVDFTQGGGEGDRPIVVSYDSSPAFTIAEDGTSTTEALLETCFTQVEYAGVLAGAANPAGGRELVQFLLSPEVQAALPDAMYVFPVVEATPLPTDWASFAQQPTAPLEVTPAEISAHREAWLQEWSDVTTR